MNSDFPADPAKAFAGWAAKFAWADRSGLVGKSTNELRMALCDTPVTGVSQSDTAGIPSRILVLVDASFPLSLHGCLILVLVLPYSGIPRPAILDQQIDGTEGYRAFVGALSTQELQELEKGVQPILGNKGEISPSFNQALDSRADTPHARACYVSRGMHSVDYQGVLVSVNRFRHSDLNRVATPRRWWSGTRGTAAPMHLGSGRGGASSRGSRHTPLGSCSGIASAGYRSKV
jgi:hypothetical protein